jgi:hypothetical protein
MVRMNRSKGAFGVVMASVMAASMSCSTADSGFTSVGRGAPLVPAIPAEQWEDPADHEAFPPAEIDGYPERVLAGRPAPACRTDRRVPRLGPERRGARGHRAAAGRSLHVEGLLCRPRALVRPALLPLQQPLRARITVARGDDRRRSAALGRLGTLRPGLPARGDRQPLPVRDGPGPLRGAARGNARPRAGRPSTPTPRCPASGTAATSGGAGRTGTRSCCGTSFRPSSRCSRRSTRRAWCRRPTIRGTRMCRTGRPSTAGPRASCGGGTTTP